MIVNLQVLNTFKDTIECNKCGECCGNCSARNGSLCSVHPSIIGIEEADKFRGAFCPATPVELALFGRLRIACPLVVELLKQLQMNVEITRDPETQIPIFISVIPA